MSRRASDQTVGIDRGRFRSSAHERDWTIVRFNYGRSSRMLDRSKLNLCAHTGAAAVEPRSRSSAPSNPQPRRPTILIRADTTNPDEVGAAEFGISCRELDETTTVIAVEGDLDLSTAPRLKWMLLDALHEDRDRIVLDLSQTGFMDSTALGVLVVVNRRLAADARLAIVCERPAVLRIFELSGMDGAFAIFPTFEHAYAHVHRAATGAD